MTTRQLVLIRHAKAADGPTDRQRPLAPRGLNDAAAIGSWLREQSVQPDHVVVSPALRATQTWQHAASALGSSPEPDYDDRVYDNTVEDLFAVIRETSGDVRSLAIVGHNPSLLALAGALDDRTGDAALRSQLHSGLPTSGVAVFAVDQAWADLDPHTATLTHVATPRG